MEASDSNLTDFAEASPVQAAQRVMADRERFVLSEDVAEEVGRDERAPRLCAQGCRPAPAAVALLARLGVHRDHEGRGLGAALLRARVAALSEEMGCRGALRVGAGAEFYLHLVPEFESSPTDELRLVLLLEHIKRTLRRGPR